MADTDERKEWMSIGALSRATGIAVATLRSWERRYGFPKPMRRESGHRRYALADVDRLRLIKRALELGNRPSAVVDASEETLTRLIEMVPSETPSPEPGAHIGHLLAYTRWLDEPGLSLALRQAADDLGLRRFVHECAVPFLRAVGDAWAQGRLGVMHEHFASDRLKHLLVERRRGYGDGDARVVCAALPMELHDLGLHLAALLLAFGGTRVVFLGANTPIDDIAGAAQQSNARGVLVGSSVTADAELVLPQLTRLRSLLPPDVRVAAGGVETTPDGIALLADLHELERWGAELTRAGGRA